MPRRARVLSESGTYHVILRGIDRQRIFEDDTDEQSFLRILEDFSSECGFDILAYCLMGNHAHLLIRSENEPISSVMKRITVKYAYWFNARYDRVGHLFQDRFKSEPVEDDAYLLTVFRYILRNPVKAGIVDQPFDYRASSAHDYLHDGGITDTELISSMLSRDELISFVRQENNDACLEANGAPIHRLTDDDAREVIFDICGCSSVADFQSLGASEQRAALFMMSESGVSLRQASRLTGLTVGVIRGALKKAGLPR